MAGARRHFEPGVLVNSWSYPLGAAWPRAGRCCRWDSVARPEAKRDVRYVRMTSLAMECDLLGVVTPWRLSVRASGNRWPPLRVGFAVTLPWFPTWPGLLGADGGPQGWGSPWFRLNAGSLVLPASPPSHV